MQYITLSEYEKRYPVHVTLVCLVKYRVRSFFVFLLLHFFITYIISMKLLGFCSLHHSILMLFVILGSEFLLSAGGPLYGRICPAAATGIQSSTGITALWLPKIKRFRGT